MLALVVGKNYTIRNNYKDLYIGKRSYKCDYNKF